jgi:hypothetical protein
MKITRYLTFNKTYFIITVALFLIEVFIALYVRDRFVRPYLGDFLVVILIYAFLKSFLNIRPITAAIIVLIFSFTIEFLQYFKLVEILGLQDSELARVILGTSYHWLDLVAYFLGILAVVLVERFRK